MVNFKCFFLFKKLHSVNFDILNFETRTKLELKYKRFILYTFRKYAKYIL